MKILIICQWFPPELAPIGVMLDEMAQDLRRMGHRVTIVTGFPNHPKGVIFPGYKKRLFSVEERAGVRIVRCWLYTSPKKTILKRLWNFASFAVTSFLAVLRLERQDILFIVSPPLSNGVIALLLKRLRGLPFVFNVQDIYPDAAISAGVIRNPLLITLLTRVERAIYRGAWKVAAISDGFRKNIIAKGVPEEKIAVIPNWLDTTEITPHSDENEFAERNGISGKFVVLYSGTIGLISGAEILVECAQMLKTHQDIQIVVVGEGVVKEAMEKKAQEQKVDNILFLPFQPREILSQVQSAADVSVVTLLKGKGMSSVPSKVLGYLAAARPVIASVDTGTDTERLIREAGCGICVPAEDATALAMAIEGLYLDRERARRLGEHGREYLVAHCDRKMVTSCYDQLFRQCLKD